MNVKDSKMETFLKTVFIYFSVMIFVLWISSVVESFIPLDSRWLIITLQALFVIKITFIVGLLLIPLLLFVKNPSIIRIGLAVVLAVLIYILIESNIAVLTHPFIN